MPSAEIAAFDRQINRARDLSGVATSLAMHLTGAMELSDLHRAAFVQGVSAFDTFVHSEVRVRMLVIFSDPTIVSTPAFDRFKVSLSSVTAALLATGDPVIGLAWFENEIREQHSYLSFQQPDKVAEAVRLISDVKLWQELAQHLGQGPEGGETGDKILKRRLALIVDRRNTIVHESDVDPTPPGDTLYPMTRDTAYEALDFLSAVAHGIQAVT